MANWWGRVVDETAKPSRWRALQESLGQALQWLAAKVMLERDPCFDPSHARAALAIVEIELPAKVIWTIELRGEAGLTTTINAVKILGGPRCGTCQARLSQNAEHVLECPGCRTRLELSEPIARVDRAARSLAVLTYSRDRKIVDRSV